MSWTAPDDLAAQVRRRWDRGEILSARLTGEHLFPMSLRLSRPGAADITQRFDDVRRWARLLTEQSRASRGFGYEIEQQQVNHRVHGRNSLPSAAVIPTEDDALRLIGKTREAARFSQIAQLTLARFPLLRDWLTRRPLVVLEYAEDWERILAVLDYFHTRPRPGVYLRQLDIPDVDSKFIEQRKALLTELLDLSPQLVVDEGATGIRGFERRYGLLTDTPLIRFRVLDSALAVNGLSDISVPPDQFAQLNLPVRNVFITENKINGLAFPPVKESIVIFGLGYGLERLGDIGWLRQTTAWYWGDIDVDGFLILDRFRGNFPDAKSFLMDRETLMTHRVLWVAEPRGARVPPEPTRLTAAEKALFEELNQDRIDKNVRLEQERINYAWLRKALQGIEGVN